MKAFHLLLVMYSVVGDIARAAPYKRHRPIIFVPGMDGNQLDAKLNKSSSDRNCSLLSDWTTKWLGEDTIVSSFDCFVEHMRLLYGPVTRTYNTPGVEIRVPEFDKTSYMDPRIDQLLRDLGYKTDVSVSDDDDDDDFDPSLDFAMRSLLSDYFNRMTEDIQSFFWNIPDIHILEKPVIIVIHDLGNNLRVDYYLYNETEERPIEKTYYTVNNHQPVILIGHGLGNLQILYFLNRQTQEWKKKHIRAFVSISGPYGGSPAALRQMISGHNLTKKLIDAREIREVERSMTSSAWMLPYNKFWNEDEVLVQGPTRNYTVKDYKALFDDIGFPTGFLMRQDIENLIKDMKAPDVEAHCLYGVNVPTISSLSYDSWDSDPEFSYEDGDGTVPLRSLQGCNRWKEQQTEAVFVKEFYGAQHSEILDNDEVKAYISKLLQK